MTAKTNEQSTAVKNTTKAVATQPKETKDQVLKKVEMFQKNGALSIPKDYSPENAVQAAWLYLSEVKTRDGKKALEVCTQNSIASSLFEMVVKGLSVVKKQCYFVPYGSELTLVESYFGKLAQVRRMTDVKDVKAILIFENDKKGFKYKVNVSTGGYELVEHPLSFGNINNNEISGGYAIVQYNDGSTEMMQPMTMVEIRQSWQQGATKGQSPAHKNFPGEMAKRTIINRAIKLLLSSSDDSYLSKPDETEPEQKSQQPEAIEAIQEVNLDTIEAAEVVPDDKEEPKEGLEEDGF